MDGLQADHAGDLFLPDDHRLANGHPPVHPAHKVELEETVFGDAGNDDPHLVHVGGQHQPVPGGLFALFKDDQVSNGVGVKVGGAGLNPADQIAAHLVLVAGDAVEQAQLF